MKSLSQTILRGSSLPHKGRIFKWTVRAELALAFLFVLRWSYEFRNYADRSAGPSRGSCTRGVTVTESRGKSTVLCYELSRVVDWVVDGVDRVK